MVGFPEPQDGKWSSAPYFCTLPALINLLCRHVVNQKPPTPSEAFSALQLGDEKGLHFFFYLYYTSLAFYAAGLLHNKAAGEEIASEAFVKLWNSAFTIEEVRQVKFFLYRVVHNASIDYLRQQQAHLRVAREWEQRTPAESSNALQELIQTQTNHRLYQLVNQLPFKCRQVFQLFYFGNKALKEIAEELGISLNTVKTHKQKAVDFLRTHKSSLLLSVIIVSLS